MKLHAPAGWTAAHKIVELANGYMIRLDALGRADDGGDPELGRALKSAGFTAQSEMDLGARAEALNDSNRLRLIKAAQQRPVSIDGLGRVAKLSKRAAAVERNRRGHRAAMFAQITKVDEEKRLIFARAAQEVPDLSGEIMDYETTAPHFRAWSDETKKATNGKSLGNVRAMHDAIAAGKVTGIYFNDAEKAIDMQVKVVDDTEWNKVLDGVYTGLSMGGEYVQQWQDGGLTRYTAKPIEVSLVDKPCIPTALFFDVRKANGATVRKKFKGPPRVDLGPMLKSRLTSRVTA